MKLRCPECRSDNIILNRRSGYVLKFTICLGVILVSCAFPLAIIYEDMRGLSAFLGIALFLLVSLISSAIGIYFLAKAIRTKKTHYYCEYCKTILENPLVEEGQKQTAKELLAQIRRPL